VGAGTERLTGRVAVTLPRLHNLFHQPEIVNTVAEKIDEFSSAENPPNCAGGIREFCYVTFIVGRFLVSLRNTSTQLTLSECYFLLFYNTLYFTRFLVDFFT
jgi:hypothetical protein